MEATKKCQQCGEIKLESAFRPYYPPMKGYYKTCKQCEAVNTRRKYLVGKMTKGTLSVEEGKELETIDKLYSILEASGLKPPRIGSRTTKVVSMTNSLEAEIQRRQEALDSAQLAAKQRINATISDLNDVKESGLYPVAPGSNRPEYVIPAELVEWLGKDLTGYDPEVLQDDTAEYLSKKYRPQTGLNGELKPVYDDTHRTALNAVLKRFDDYEDSYEG
jgi:hypothetical protein